MEIQLWICEHCDAETYNWRKCKRCGGNAIFVTFVPKTQVIPANLGYTKSNQNTGDGWWPLGNNNTTNAVDRY